MSWFSELFGASGSKAGPSETTTKAQAQTRSDIEKRQKALNIQRMRDMSARRNQSTDFGDRDQNALIQQLQRSAAGEGPSAAQAQLKQATDQNMRQALAFAASGRGNPALARQAAARNIAAAGQQAASQSAALRAGEMQQAQQLLGQQTAARSQLQTQAELQQAAQNDAMQQFYEQGLNNLLAQQVGADTGYTGAQVQEMQGAENRKANRENSLISGIIGGTADAITAAVMSDERAKKGIAKIDPRSLDDFFASLKPKSFEYKNKADGYGEKVGLMAQDVEKTELGKKLFSESKGGMKAYDPQVLDGIMLAAIKKIYGEKNGRSTAKAS